jgi:hypothetical protein
VSEDSPELIFVLAAGNDGGVFSVSSPANAKNVLAVGASTAPWGYFAGVLSEHTVSVANGAVSVAGTSANFLGALECDMLLPCENLPIATDTATGVSGKIVIIHVQTVSRVVENEVVAAAVIGTAPADASIPVLVASVEGAAAIEAMGTASIRLGTMHRESLSVKVFPHEVPLFRDY